MTAAVSIFSAYLCCQIPWWCAFFFNLFISNKIAYTIIYVLSTLIVFWVIYTYTSKTIHILTNLSKKKVLLIGAVPLVYYIFDYATTVYTNWLYLGHTAVVQFMPFVIACFYFIFIIIYFKEFSSKEEARYQANILELQLQHASASIEHMRQLQEYTVTYRHDMRHHLSYIQTLAASKDLEKIQSYISTIQSDIDSITPTRYCRNELINYVLSEYTLKSKGNFILDIQANVPKDIPITDTKLCVLLSNALENAINATTKTDDKNIFIRLTTRGSLLMIQISNPFSGKISWENGLPVTSIENHGYGVKSIVSIVNSCNGQYDFSENNHVFTLRILLPM